MENMLEISNLTKKYEGFALNGVSLNLPRGSIMGLVGENGAGKTTLIKLVLNLIRRDKGEVRVFGLDNINNESQIKEDIGVVFDECHFPNEINSRDVGRVMRNIYKNWDDARYQKCLERFSLPAGKPVKDYSRGMKMKLSIAAALSHKARLLILDEATSGLDPVVRDEILTLFFEFIEDENHSILLSSHIVSDLEKISDYIALIHKGELLLCEPKDSLLCDYGIVKCALSDVEKIDKKLVVGSRKNKFGAEVLVRRRGLGGGFDVDRAGIEDIMLFYIRGEKE